MITPEQAQEILNEVARKTNQAPDVEPDAQQVVADAIGPRPGVKRRTGEHTFIIEQESQK